MTEKTRKQRSEIARKTTRISQVFFQTFNFFSNARHHTLFILTYLTLNKGIERNICNNIVKSLVNRVEQLCEAAKKDTAFETGIKGVDENMSNLLLLGFANYIAPSREYKEIIRNIIQYMGGLNETGECYINSDGMLSEKKLEWNGIILFAFDEAK